MLNNKINNYLNIIFLISIFSIISALFIEHVLGHQPCNLCLMQRIPYLISIILIVMNYIFEKNKQFIILLLILIFSFSFILSFYHFGIEQGFFKESAVCGLKNASDIITKEEILSQLQEKNVSCKDVTFKILGLSLTSYNIIISILIVYFTIRAYLSYDNNK